MSLLTEFLAAGIDPAQHDSVFVRRVRTLRLSTIAMVAFAAPVVVLYWSIDAPVLALCHLAAMVGCTANLYLLRRTLRTDLCGHLAVLMLFVLLVAAAYYGGGFHQPNFAWLYIVPLASGTLIDMRACWIWVGICTGTALGFWGLEHGFGVGFPDAIASEHQPVLFLVSRTFALGAVGILATTFITVQRQLESALRKSHAEIQALAYYDPLTGLPNRQLFQKRLRPAIERARRERRQIGLLFLDLDGFKTVNDTLGHRGGDQLLKEVGERFRRCVRLSDCLARPTAEPNSEAVSRLGGDEFTVLLWEVAGPQGAARAARRILDALAQPFNIGGREVFAGASIGIALFPAHGGDAETLLRNADTAMYEAKARGRNNLQFFTTALSEESARRLALENRLRHAAQHGEFRLCYQPVRDVKSGRLVAAEALLRWSDPESGPLSPAEFVPVAEQCGLIDSIGEWVLRAACVQARAWMEAGYRPFRLAVNLSGHQVQRQGFVPLLRTVLAESDLSPAWLELEITESTIMQDSELTRSVLREISDMGLGLALDDFGTGHSSLYHLKRFPIDRIKIDRSFISEIPADANDCAITSGIIAMAHSLRLEVVAEGVETLEQLAFLRERGCDQVQGFLFSPAVKAAEFERFLEREKDDEA